jgi:hypothetical protein
VYRLRIEVFGTAESFIANFNNGRVTWERINPALSGCFPCIVEDNRGRIVGTRKRSTFADGFSWLSVVSLLKRRVTGLRDSNQM